MSREGVEFLHRQYTNGQGGILGDDMGLGKTVAVFLAALLKKTGTHADRERAEAFRKGARGPDAGSHAARALEAVESEDRERNRDESEDRERDRVLVIAPSSVVHQWVLVIAPASVVHQWKAELLTWSFFDVGLCLGASQDSILRQAETSLLEAENSLLENSLLEV
ncbi:hypothetical protein T484DRAFT_1786457 [Baffinella frigidus]|nr:hypothetical protein T484DRAFT_1786457 [Cryptophyta sp. CCMP2293]